jgi:hypothetical protein
VGIGPRLEALLLEVDSQIPFDPKDIGLLADYEELESRGLVTLHRHLSGNAHEKHFYMLFAVLTPAGEAVMAAIRARRQERR